MPLITGYRIHVITVDNFGINPSMTRMIPAAIIAMRLATPVMARIPAFDEYPVIGVPPNSDPTKQPIPSPELNFKI